MSKVSIRPMTFEDREAFVDLTAHRPGFNRAAAEKRTQVIWHIAFENPTSDGGPTYFVATDGSRLLCHMGRIPTWFFLEGERHLASFAHDLFAHPDLQASGAGFFTTMKLYKSVENACQSFCGLLWTNEINVKLQQARKYDQLWVRRWVRPLDASRMIDDRLGALPNVARSALKLAGRSAIGVGDLALRRSWRRAPVERIDRADERFDRLAESVGPRLGIAPVKDRAYVHWKYFTWPNLPTTVYGVPTPGGDLRGFVVLREPQLPSDQGRVLDLVAAPDDEEAFNGLVAAAIEHFRKLRVHSVDCMGTSPPVARALGRFFFVQRLPDMPLFYLNGHKAPNPAHLAHVENWCHAFGDSEGGETP